jgi:phosphatidate cytidylyltransferase
MDNNLIQRLITGTIFVIVLVGGMLWNQWSFSILFLAITALGLWEFYGLAEKAGAKPQKLTGLLTGLLVFFFFLTLQYTTGIMITGRSIPPAALIAPFIFFIPFLLFFIELYRKKEMPFTNIAYTLLGILYVAVPFSVWSLVVIKTESHRELESLFVQETIYRPHLLLGFFILIWTSDSMAYVCGRLFGKTKLFERISPKKTWEGFIGGIGFAILAGYLLSLFFHELKAREWMVAAIIIAVTGTLGDLVESMFKRSIGVKDSGTILPGHGGILDRFDAALLATPFAVVYFLLFAR